MKQGLMHLYYGDGKGKTTAAMGLAVRALGAGLRVNVVQVLKNGQSSELTCLETLGARLWKGQAGTKFVSAMTDEEKTQVRDFQNECLARALEVPCDLLVLDEACAAWRLGMVDDLLLQKAVLGRPEGTEVVLTGRDPAPWMKLKADYITEMRCEKHPYEQGISARKGIEY